MAATKTTADCGREKASAASSRHGPNQRAGGRAAESGGDPGSCYPRSAPRKPGCFGGGHRRGSGVASVRLTTVHSMNDAGRVRDHLTATPHPVRVLMLVDSWQPKPPPCCTRQNTTWA